MNKCFFFLIFYVIYCPWAVEAQCLSSLNPVGGADNLLVLEKNTARMITFYKHGQGDKYYEGTRRSDFNLINQAYYNYLSAIVAYGITDKLTLEIESGYFLNKTQNYNLEPPLSLTGKGLSNAIIMAKRSLFAEPIKRIYITGAFGAKIPFSRDLQSSDNVKLPIQVQPTLAAYGAVFNTSFVKENSITGMRYFLTNRIETHIPNKEDYRPGILIYSSLYISKHLRQPWLKEKVTAILQIRNEIRGFDKIKEKRKESTGSVLLFIVPQLNYVFKENFYISAMMDIPVYQNFNGTQLGSFLGLTFVVSKTFRL